MVLRRCLLSLFFLTAWLGLGTSVLAQELDAIVEVNVSALPEQERINWETFKQDVFTYINNYSWATNFSGERISCTFQFNIVSQNGSDYNAQLFVTSTRPLYKNDQVTTMARFFDDQVSFPYVRGQVLQHSATYRPLESVIDYYANIILALDYDSYKPQEGTPFFQQAQQIAAVGNGAQGNGWERKVTAIGTFSRWGYVEDALNANNRVFRDVFFDYHYNGLDLLKTEPDKAKDAIASVLDTLVILKKESSSYARSPFVKSFWEAKYPEIAEMGRIFPANMNLFYQKLYYLDPLHQNYYQEARQRIEGQ